VSRSLNDVEVGGLLAVHGRFNDTRVVKVERITSTQLIAGGERFRKSDGNRVGDSDQWHRTWARVPTEDDFATAGLRRAKDKWTKAQSEITKQNYAVFLRALESLYADLADLTEPKEPA
jgi:hypothetical protein